MNSPPAGRRPPPPFLTAEVAGRDWLTPRLVRVTLEGGDLAQLEVSQPASSVRVLLPDLRGGLEIPAWDGNRFMRSDGTRPILRTLTPRYHDREVGRLQLDVVVHGEGAVARWASAAADGTPAAVSGPARGYSIDPDLTTLVLGGDETAIAAIGQIIEALPDEVVVAAYLEIATPDARPALPAHPRLTVLWPSPSGGLPGQALAEALGEVELPAGARLWVAGEAAAVQLLRQRLFQERGLPRTRATIRGYWKHGRSSEDDSDTGGG
jgi:NADPH-dependent ferric siderophore reductase